MATDGTQNQSTQWDAFISYGHLSERDGQIETSDDASKRAVEKALQTLAKQALAQTQLISSDVVVSIEAMISAIDVKISHQVNEILHAPELALVREFWQSLQELVERPTVRAHWKIFLESENEGATVLVPTNDDILLRLIASDLLMCSVETKECVERLRDMQSEADALIALLRSEAIA